jgi:uncharacterized circularly permuted ATP-grasp superfamily protein
VSRLGARPAQEAQRSSHPTPRAAPSGASLAAAYATPEGAWDEALLATGTVRPHYARTLDALASLDLGDLATRTAVRRRSRRVVFGGPGGERDFVLDPVPRLFEAAEWAQLEAGLAQRVRALDAFCADVYGERAILAAGVLPERILTGLPFAEADLIGMSAQVPGAGPWISIAGLDVVRDGQGCLRVLEDNLRTPSGMAYALAAREIVRESLAEQLGDFDRGAPPRPVHQELARMLRGVVARPPPQGTPDDATVLLSDGPVNSAWFEHRALAELTGVPLVGPEQLRRRGDRLELRADGRPVGVVYRRTDQERARLPDGSLTQVGELMLAPVLAGTLRIVNGFGTGVADDKMVYPHVEKMIGFYLGEEPLARSVQTFDLGEREEREQALERLNELVVKPRDGHGGAGVLVGPHASDSELRRAAQAIAEDPGRWIAQETVMLSTHPTVVNGRLAPRHVDLRPFVFFDGTRAEVLPGGLTRVAMREGSLIVNSSRQGGGKDTWVLE